MLDVKMIRWIYANGRGLCELSLQVMPGEVLAVVGPNGSGKTTAMRLIGGLVRPQIGTCSLDGTETYGTDIKAHIGYVAEEGLIYPRMSVRAFLDFVCAVKFPGLGVSDHLDLMRRFQLEGVSGAAVGTLSLGMRRRVGLVAALMNRPELLVVDEPMNGLDTASVITLKRCLREAAFRGAHVVVSGHDLDFIHSVAARIVFLRDGLAICDMPNDKELLLDALYESYYQRAVGET